MLLKQEWECRVSHILNESNDTVIYIYIYIYIYRERERERERETFGLARNPSYEMTSKMYRSFGCLVQSEIEGNECTQRHYMGRRETREEEKRWHRNLSQERRGKKQRIS